LTDNSFSSDATPSPNLGGYSLSTPDSEIQVHHRSFGTKLMAYGMCNPQPIHVFPAEVSVSK